LTPLESVFHVLSKKEHLELFSLIARSSEKYESFTFDRIIAHLSLTKKQFESRVLTLMSYALVKVINDRYVLTTMGKEVFEALQLMELAVAIRTKLRAVDLINQSDCTTPEEYNKILTLIIKNTEVRKIVEDFDPHQYVRIRFKRNKS
jgi:hypothetical protein